MRACDPPEVPWCAPIKTQRGNGVSGAGVVVKVALMLPAGTVTLGGVMTCPSILPCRVTSAPPAGAGEVSLTVPVTLPPAGIDDWLKVRDERQGGGVGLPAGVKVIQVCGAR